MLSKIRLPNYRILSCQTQALKDNGEFVIWDVIIPQYPGETKGIFVVPLEIKLRDKIVSTAYGVSWDEREQNRHYCVELVKERILEL